MIELESRPGGTDKAVGDEATTIRRRSRDRRRHRRRATVMYLVASIVFLALLGGLGFAGYRASRRIRGGFTTHRITDPAAPGYEVAVLPTPVHLAVLADESARLVDAYLFIGGTSTKGGSVLWVVGDLALGAEGESLQSLDSIYANGGLDEVRDRLEHVLGLGISDAITLGPAQMQRLLEPAGTLTVNNPDPLFVLNGNQRREAYPSGKLRLTPGDATRFISLRANGEAATNRATRAGLVIDAYFAALATLSSGPSSTSSGATPGSDLTTDGGEDLLAVTKSMAGERVAFKVMPVRDKPLGSDRYFTPDEARIEPLMNELVPFPVSAFPGQRPRVRLVSSPDHRDAPAEAASTVVAAGGEIIVIGNAKGAVGPTTTVEYHDPSQVEPAQRIAARFGVTAVASADQTETYDVTVTLGTEYHG